MFSDIDLSYSWTMGDTLMVVAWLALTVLFAVGARAVWIRRASVAAAALIAILALPSSSHAQAEAATAWAYCFAGQPSHCGAAGQHYLDGTGGAPRTPSWATLAWTQGCDNGDVRSCALLGTLHENGNTAAGVGRNPRRAAQLYDSACRANDGFGCQRLGALARAGGAPRHQARVAEIFQKGCDLGSAQACIDAANYTDRATGRQLRARACELGHTAACVVAIGENVAQRSRNRRAARRERRRARRASGPPR